MKAPTSTVGSRPALISRCPSRAVVVDLPCVPVTARPMRPSAVISSPSTACQVTTGSPRSCAATSSGRSGTARSAGVMATRSTPSRWAGSWPDRMRMPAASSGGVYGEGVSASQPSTRSPA